MRPAKRNADASVTVPAVSSACTTTAFVCARAIRTPVATGRICINAPVIALVRMPRVNR
jgi:hypothetical protein